MASNLHDLSQNQRDEDQETPEVPQDKEQDESGFNQRLEEESLSTELKSCRQKLIQQEILQESLLKEIECLRLLLQTSISDQSSMIHRLKEEGVIQSRKVYQALLMIDIRDFESTGFCQTSLTEDASTEDPESVVRDYAVQLECLASHVSPGSKVLILIKDFSGAMFLFLAAMISGKEMTKRNSSLEEEPGSASTSSTDSLSTSTPRGCVIGKTSRADAQVLMSKYSYLVESGVLKINVFSDSTDMKKGYIRSAPFDIILVPAIGWSEGLKSQLKTGGMVVNPLEKGIKLQKNSSGNFVSI